MFIYNHIWYKKIFLVGITFKNFKPTCNVFLKRYLEPTIILANVSNILALENNSFDKNFEVLKMLKMFCKVTTKWILNK